MCDAARCPVCGELWPVHVLGDVGCPFAESLRL